MPETKALILFDGVCNLCSGFVQFVIARDQAGYFKFGSLQSDEAQIYLEKCRLSGSELTSIVLYENGKCYTRSEAALRIFKKLSGGWPLMFGFMAVPKFIRDQIYNFIAMNRYRWFGKQESCWLPTPELNDRFL